MIVLGCRILRAKLAAQLDPDNLIWATEMMQMCEYYHSTDKK